MSNPYTVPDYQLTDSHALRHALALRRLDVRTIPIREGKNPKFAGWQKLLHVPIENFTDQYIRELFQTNTPENGFEQNVGIICGGGLVVFDADSAEAIQWAEKNLPNTPWQVSRGTSDRRHFYFKSSNPELVNRNFTGLLDFLSAGKQVVAVGSIHPDTKQYYEWISSPQKPLSYLPEFTSEMYQAMIEFGESRNDNSPQGRNNATLDLARKSANIGVPIDKAVAMCINNYRENLDNSSDPDSNQQIEATVRSAYDFVDKNPPSNLNAAVVATVAGGKAEIRDPEPLGPPEVKIAEYPVHALGSLMGGAVQVIATGIQAPLESIANSVLATAATAAQTHALIESPHGALYPLSLLAMTVVNSGERKSAVHKVVTQGLHDAEKVMMRDYSKLFESYSIAQNVFESEQKKILSNKDLNQEQKNNEIESLEKPVKPLVPNLIINNVTAEGLHKSLEIGYPSVGLLSDEGGMQLGGHAFMPEQQLRLMTMVSALWDGSSVDRHRGGDGSSKLENRAFSMHLMVQGAVGDLLLSNEMARSQGLLNRMLICEPESLVGKRTYTHMRTAEMPEVQSFRRSVNLLASKPISFDKDRPAELNRSIITLTDDAIAAYEYFHNFIEAQVGKNNYYEGITGYAIRAPEQALRLATIMLMMETAPNTQTQLNKDYFDRGVVLAHWYVVEQQRLFNRSMLHQDKKLAEQLLEFACTLPVQADGSQHIIRRDVSQYGPNAIRPDAKFKHALNLLLDKGHLIANERGKVLIDCKGETRQRRNSWMLVRVA